MIEVQTPCRLHFGLLAYNPREARQFGGIGLMVERPRIVLRVSPAQDFVAYGPMAPRAESFARTFASNWAARLARSRPLRAKPLSGAKIQITSAPRPHTGLGTGTQLAMAVARAMAELAGATGGHLGVEDLAALVGRGARSAIGAHGFFHGGLIIEGGKQHRAALSPMLVQQSFPSEWRIVLITPASLVGHSGDREVNAFATMPPIPREVTAEMCRLVMLGLLPAAIERDLSTFSRALFDLQQRVGECFASVQGGIYAAPLLQRIVTYLREGGIEGVGQSSWGPTLYALTGDENTAMNLARDVQAQFELSEEEVIITAADNEGCRVMHASNEANVTRTA
ncbi:MAG: beta-ribofuranosylaminobenzene 5'-phosphate synthase family protein [Phycisphaeraceae bacterium]